MSKRGYRFGEFVLDRQQGVLLGPAGQIELRPQTWRLLEVLLERAPELIPHHELLDAAWGHEHLSPNVVPQAISELRQALADRAQAPRYIATVHRRGYRMACPVTAIIEPEPAAAVDTRPIPVAKGRPRATPRAWLAAGLGMVALGLILILALPRTATGPERKHPAAAQERAVVALGLFPHQDEVPDWIPAAGLELLTQLLATDDRILILRGDSLQLSMVETGARWQHAMRDLLGAPLALSGHWRIESSGQIRLDLNLIELDSGRLLDADRHIAAPEQLDQLLAGAAARLRQVLDLPGSNLPAGWHELTPALRQRYWQGLAAMNQGQHERAASLLGEIHESLGQPDWLAPTLARAQRQAGRWEIARQTLAPALEAPHVLRGLGSSLRLRAELAHLNHQPGEVAAALRALTALFPDEADLALELALAELDSLEGDAARRTITRLSRHTLMQHDPRLQLLQARLARLDGQLEQAESLGRQVIDQAMAHDLPALAVQAALILSEIQRASGKLSQAGEQLSQVHEIFGQRISPGQRHELLLQEIGILRHQGEHGAASDRIERLLAEGAAPHLQLRARIEQALIEAERGQFEQAAGQLSALAAEVEAQAEPDLSLAFLSARGRVKVEQGLQEAARDDFDQAFELARRTGRAHHVAGLQVNSGMMLAHQRRFEEADHLWERALVVFRAIGDRRGQALCLSNLAASAAARGLEERGQELNQQALALFQELGMANEMARTSFNLALLAMRQGNMHEAGRLFARARAHYEATASASFALAAGTREAEALVALGQFELAGQLLENLQDHLVDANLARQAEWHLAFGQLLQWSGQAADAARAYSTAHDLYQQAELPSWMLHTGLQRLQLDLLNGRHAGHVLIEAEQAVREATRLSEPRTRARALGLVAEALLIQDRRSEARIQLREAYAALGAMPDVRVELHLDWLEAWLAEPDERRMRLERLAERLRQIELTPRLTLVELALSEQPPDAQPGQILPAYARLQTGSLP